MAYAMRGDASTAESGQGPAGDVKSAGGSDLVRFRGLLPVLLALLIAGSAGAQGASGGVEQPSVLQPVQDLASKALQLLHNKDAAGATAAMADFESLWKPVEDGIRAKSLDIYARVEVASSRAAAALQATPPDLAVAQSALEGLQAAASDSASGASVGTTAAGQKGLSALLTMIRQVKAALDSGDTGQATDLMNSFQEIWPLAEADVQTRSQATYAQIEKEITQSSALLLSGADARAQAAAVVGSMEAQLDGLSGRTGYTVWDAGLILLREGLEALLVLAALLAALRKSGTGDGARWVWAGAGTGLLASAAVAVVLVYAITAATAGTARETMEGAVGLASVAIMVTVGAWLHGRASNKAWQGFIKGKVGTAVAGGRMWTLYALALFAVLREGAEATVFYIGIAQGIGIAQLLIGIAGALVILAIAGFVIIRFSVKLPLHWVFLAATLLIYYLAIKITGESVRALQAASVLPSHFVGWLPSLGFIGTTPTWEVFLPQLVVLALVLSEIVITESKRGSARPKQAA
jgi:high-affinity iron transporter